MSENNATFVGNLVRDPELRYTSSGQATVTLGLAVSRRWQDRTTEEWKEATSFFNVVLWGDVAERAAESFVKGSRVMAVGRLEQRSWETEEGVKKTVTELSAWDVGASIKYDPLTIRRAERVSRGSADS